MNSTVPQYHCILVAAGSGHRMGIHQPKQYLKVAGRTLLEWSAQPFLVSPLVSQVIVVIAKEDTFFSHLPLANHAKVRSVVGGQERYQSVLSGLNALSGAVQSSDWVLVHDAARPNLSLEDLHDLMATVGDHDVGGILGTPVTDSLKRVNADHRIQEEVARDSIWRALTPQLFRFGLLHNALREVTHLGSLPTDESAAVGRLGYSPLVVRGRSDNIKVTTQEDYEILKRLILEKSGYHDESNKEAFV